MNHNVHDLQKHREFNQRVQDGLRTLTDPAVPPFDPAFLDEARHRAARNQKRLVVLASAGTFAVAATTALIFAIPAIVNQTGTEKEYLPAEGETPSSVVTLAPPDGFRWESFNTVNVAVPTEWGNGSAPHPDYCHREDTPTLPYIDTDYINEPSHGTCESFPDMAQTMHVTLNPAQDPSPWNPISSLWQQKQIVAGEVRITIVYQQSNAELADQILNSAHQQ